jgi:hypothetical protein
MTTNAKMTAEQFGRTSKAQIDFNDCLVAAVLPDQTTITVNPVSNQ